MEDYIAMHFSEYSRDKSMILDFIDGKEALPLAALIEKCEKWQRYPAFRRGLEDYYGQLKALAAHSEEEDEELEKRKSEEPRNQEELEVLLPASPPDSLRSPQRISRAPCIRVPDITAVAYKRCNETETEKQGSSGIGSRSREPSSRQSITRQLIPADIHRYFREHGIIGEENNQELLVYGLLGQCNIGIESLSGSGKSALLYTLISLLPESSYRIIHQASAKSLFLDEHASEAQYWFIPELQKIFNQNIEEIIKNLTEGVDATYTRSNSSRDGIDSFAISRKPVYYSFAITNRHAGRRDAEFFRRFIILHTDISSRQTREVALHYSREDFMRDDRSDGDDKKHTAEGSIQPEEHQPLKEHLQQGILLPESVRNPFLEHLINTFPPAVTSHLRFRSSVKYLQSMVKGKTLYSALLPKKKSRDFIFSTLEDNLRILSLYFPVLLDNLYGISVVDKAVLELVRETEKGQETGATEERGGLYGRSLEKGEPERNGLDKGHLEGMFLEQYGSSFTGERVISDSIEKLVAFGFLQKEGLREGGALRTAVHQMPAIDAEEVLGLADKLMRESFPEYREEWYLLNQKQLEEGGKAEKRAEHYIQEDRGQQEDSRQEDDRQEHGKGGELYA